jgi:protein TonB
MAESAVPPLSMMPPSQGGGGGLESIGWERRDNSSFILLAAVVVAMMGHAALGVGATQAPLPKKQERITMAVVKPPPPPPPPPPPVEEVKPEPPEPPKPAKPKELPPPPPPDTPPPPPSNSDPPPEPSEPVPIVTGISMNSVVQGSSGPAVRVGNTTFGDPNKEKFTDPNEVKPYAGGEPGFKAARSSSITREARPIKTYKAPYPRELADANIEGTVTLLVEITKAGAVRTVRIVKSCGNAVLDKIAQDALRKFVFDAAEVDGEKVDSLLRYTYRFELVD